MGGLLQDMSRVRKVLCGCVLVCPWEGLSALALHKPHTHPTIQVQLMTVLNAAVLNTLHSCCFCNFPSMHALPWQ